MSTIDKHFISVTDHIMKSSGIWQHLFHNDILQIVDWNTNEGVCEFGPAISSEDISVLANITHRVTFQPLVREILTLDCNHSPFKAFTGNLSLFMTVMFGCARNSSNRGVYFLLLRILRASNYSIIQSSESICHGWIFLVNQILLPQLKIKLILMVRQKLQKDNVLFTSFKRVVSFVHRSLGCPVVP